MGRPPKPEGERYRTPLASFRIPVDVMRAAKRRAAAEGTTVTAVVVAALRRYGKDYRD